MGSSIFRIATSFPDRILTNDELAENFPSWNADKISNKVGVVQRRVAAEYETAGDLAFNAASKVLEEYDKEKIDMLILCTQSPDYFLPTTACVIQARLKLNNNVAAFDFNLGCSGYIYGLAIAKSFIESGSANNVLLLTSDTYTKHLRVNDVSNRSIFGDGAAATIIEKCEVGKISNFVLGTDGTGADNLIVKGGCFRASDDIDEDYKLYMNGPEIFNFTIGTVPSAIKECLKRNGTNLEEIDYFIFHQANKFMLDYLRKKIRIPKNKFHINLREFGNTVSATIPIAIKQATEDELIQSGDKIMLCGFGVGYSWGAVIIEL